MEILNRVVNNKLRMVYYLIVYTVLLVQFPKKKCLAPPINKTWIRHCSDMTRCRRVWFNGIGKVAIKS